MYTTNILQTEYRITKQWNIAGYQDPYLQVKPSVYENELDTVKRVYRKITDVYVYDFKTKKESHFKNVNEVSDFIATIGLDYDSKSVGRSMRDKSLALSRFLFARTQDELETMIQYKELNKRQDKKIYCETNGKLYDSIKKAAKDIGANHSTLSISLKRYNGYCKGYQFRYA